MTTPAERLRALRQAEELLDRIDADPQLPDIVRQRAHDIVLCFPSQQELLVGRMTPGATLSSSAAQAIFDAGVFLAALGWRDIVDTDVRLLLETVMRHYPTDRDGWQSASSLLAMPVNELLAG